MRSLWWKTGAGDPQLPLRTLDRRYHPGGQGGEVCEVWKIDRTLTTCDNKEEHRSASVNRASERT